MRAYGTANGGVMFVPDEIEQVAIKKSALPASEKKMLRKDPSPKTEKRFVLFGRRRKDSTALQDAA